MTHHPDLQTIRAKLRSLQEDDVLPPPIEPDWQTPQQRLAERAATAPDLSFAVASASEPAEPSSSDQQADAIAALQRRSQQGQPSANGAVNGSGNGSGNSSAKGQDYRQKSLQMKVPSVDQSQAEPAHSPAAGSGHGQTIAEAIAQHAMEEGLPPQAAADPEVVPASSAPASGQVSSYASTQTVANPPDPSVAAAQRWQQSRQKIQLQIQQINQLAQLQETAIRDLRVMSEVAAHWQRVVAEDQGVPSHRVILPFCWSNQPLGVPVIQQNQQGQWLVQTRFIDLLQAEREAEQMATQLRHRQLRSHPQHPAQLVWQHWLQWLQLQWRQIIQWLGLAKSRRRSAHAARRASSTYAGSTSSMQSVRESPGQYGQQWSNSTSRSTSYSTSHSQSGTAPPRSARASSHQSSTPSSAFSMPDFSLLDISIWITGAAIARVGLDWMLVNLPFTAPVVIGLILAVTGWAVYRATTDSNLTLTLGYRALLLMIGLLLGGRL